MVVKSSRVLTDAEKFDLCLEAGKAFTPASPVSEENLFAGRYEQMRQVVDVVNQRGQHVMIFGERGVGKTSLANILASKLTTREGTQVLAPRVNCDATDTHASLWRKILAQVDLTRKIRHAGFGDLNAEYKQFSAADELGSNGVSPDDIRRILTVLADEAKTLLMPIIDEFDRLTDLPTKTAIADTVKTLSDHSVNATMVIVGVADSVNELITEHRSVERALVQIRMPRMSQEELLEILRKGTERIGMMIKEEAMVHIAWLSRGLPHYTHLLGLYATKAAVEGDARVVSMAHVEQAINNSLKQAQQSIQSGYLKATMSHHTGNIYTQVLLACALAPTDQMGFFAPADVRDSLSMIMGRVYDIPSYSRHLNDFCEDTRGPVLQKTGIKHRYRFRFINPLMQPYITMQGIASGRLHADQPLRAQVRRARD
jgi:Cdc6-like AAA superfamily ATPase